MLIENFLSLFRLVRSPLRHRTYRHNCREREKFIICSNRNIICICYYLEQKGRAEMKSQNGCSDRLSYVVFLVSMLISQVSSQLIGLRFNTARSNQELRICALKKSFYSGNQDNNVPYELISLLNEDGCEPIHPPFPPYSTPNQSSLYLHTARPNCQFSTIAKNLQVYSPGLVLVGSDGPIVGVYKPIYRLVF